MLIVVQGTLSFIPAKIASRSHKINCINELCEKGILERKENIQDNLYGPLCLALLSQKYDIHYTYLGTGCIFNHNTEDDDLKGYTENSLPDFFGSSYSIVKGYTDKIMHLFKNNILNIRIRMPITDEVNDKNFITKIKRTMEFSSNI